MTLANIKHMKDERGFTIVELLIVIVIIAILAAITIIAYNGITQRANTASAQSAAKSAISKIEAYNADGPTSAYPTVTSDLTGATADKTYNLTGVTFTSDASEPSAAPAKPSVLKFYTCTTGAQVAYYKYDGTAAWVKVNTGGSTSADCTYKPAS